MIPPCRRYRWHRAAFLAAGLYNIGWGLYSVLDPQWLFRFAGMPPQRYPEIFACLAMVVGLYGILYLEVARRPERGWLLAAVGLAGKVLGPVGLGLLLLRGAWPPATLVLCLTNDLVWWIPFGLYLHDAWPAFREDLRADLRQDAGSGSCQLTVEGPEGRKNVKIPDRHHLLLAAGLALALAGCNGHGETGETQAAPDVAAVERRDLEIRAEASGQIEPVRVVEVKSKVSGELTRITVETGDEVEQGALIASVDPRDVRNAHAQAAADMELARARVETARAQRARAEQLAKEGILSTQDLENSRLEETNARAQLLKAKTNLELAQEKTADVTIRAPISGTVIEKTVEQGQIIASASGNVSGGTTLIKMADLATVRARALVDEVDIGRIQAGQDATVEVEAYPGRTFRGKVIKIEPQAVVEQNVTMFPVLVDLPNPERLLKPGMNAEVGVEVANREGVVAVPNGAVASVRDAPAAGTALGLEEKDVRDRLAKMREQRGERRQGGGGGGRAMNAGGGDVRPGVVFVKGTEGPVPKTILLGLSDWDYTEVVRGLEPGEQVYLISVARLQQQQERFAERTRQRAGGGILGGGQRSGGSTGGSRGGRGTP